MSRFLKMVLLAVSIPVAVVGGVADVEVSFTPGSWSMDDWLLVKSPRWEYKHGFVQKSDCIENECPNVSGEEVFKKYNSKVYSAMVHRQRAVLGQTISSKMGFDHRMAPLIVISEKLDKSPSGDYMFGEHWEIVLYDEGINVWHHMIKDGKPCWYRAAYLKAPYKKNVPYNLEVKVVKTRKGVKEMIVKCGDQELGYVDNDLPDSFYAGIIGCEGRNRFYDFKIK